MGFSSNFGPSNVLGGRQTGQQSIQPPNGLVFPDYLWNNARSLYFNAGSIQFLSGGLVPQYNLGLQGTFGYKVKPIASTNFEAQFISCYDHTEEKGFIFGFGTFAIGSGGAHEIYDVPLPAVGVWTDVKHVYTGSEVITYHDGVELDRKPITRPIVVPAAGLGNMLIGNYDDTNNDQPNAYYKGLAREVCIWSNAFTTAQITEITNGGVSFDYRTASTRNFMVGYWVMGAPEDDENTVLDFSPYGNNLTPSVKLPMVWIGSTQTQYFRGGTTVMAGYTQWTCLAWVGLENAQNSPALFSKYDGTSGAQHLMFAHQVDTPSQAYVFGNAAGSIYRGKQQSFPANTSAQNYRWFPMGHTWDGLTMTGFKGASIYTVDFNGGSFVSMNTDTSAEFTIGCIFWAGAATKESAKMSGFLSQMCVYDTALGQSAIAQLFGFTMYGAVPQFDPRVNVGNYNGASSLQHFWLGPGTTNTLGVSAGIIDLGIANKPLTGIGMTNANLYGTYSLDVPT